MPTRFNCCTFFFYLCVTFKWQWKRILISNFLCSFLEIWCVRVDEFSPLFLIARNHSNFHAKSGTLFLFPRPFLLTSSLYDFIYLRGPVENAACIRFPITVPRLCNKASNRSEAIIHSGACEMGLQVSSRPVYIFFPFCF